jgi:dTDP-glucose pyrophosphorylase/CBS domain-containing protein
MNSTKAQSRLRSVVVSPETSLRDIMTTLDKAGLGVTLVCDANCVLLGIITDGDIRRAILRGVSLESSCREIATADPVTATPNEGSSELLRRMDRLDVNHLPVLDAESRVVGLVVRADLITDASELPPAAVIMAGGFGTRLRPLTDKVPKPMLPLDDRPLLERTVQRLQQSGFGEVHITTHYKGEQIREHFTNGCDLGIKVSFLNEAEPLGTAGGLTLLKKFDRPVLLMNGDVVTGVDFRNIWNFHREQRADITIAVRRYEMQVPYGVLESSGAHVTALTEKPVIELLINAGIYVLAPSVARYIPIGRPFQITELIQRLIDAGRTVASFPVVEYWLDVGRPDDYEQAREDALAGKIWALPEAGEREGSRSPKSLFT